MVKLPKQVLSSSPAGPKKPPEKSRKLPHVQGTKTPISSRNPFRDIPKPIQAPKPDKAAPEDPIFAEEDVCRQFDIANTVRPSRAAMADIVMYGELSQVIHVQRLLCWATTMQRIYSCGKISGTMTSLTVLIRHGNRIWLKK